MAAGTLAYKLGEITAPQSSFEIEDDAAIASAVGP
ncbi:hypothetical protein DSM3645_25141 [Blastopirellula marina DSM 3645]|uniref:Uncharacterized protein n=1 Tax=Blastopirellula marina DSM 3645 TaxID=314230 RepID=A4A2F4_9BACT|nr:hypothetical protein DSM3645_25141 [Blastopirellula marina DSM 3645]